jgi:hypothetical protein
MRMSLPPRHRPGNAVTEKIDQAMVLLVQARRLALDPVPPIPPDPGTIHVAAGTPLQPIIDSAAASAVLGLDRGTYPGPITLRQPITIQPWEAVPNTRATADGRGVVLVGTADDDTITVLGEGATLRGLTVITCDARRQCIAFTGTNLLVDRCTVRGDAVVGAHRGLMLNGDGAIIVQSHVDQIFDVGRDTQAISGWDGTRNVVIDDCYLSGAGETVMFGGADSQNPDRIPTAITIRNSTLTKDPAWFSQGKQIKNALELKACIDFEMTDCVLEYGGISEGQGGYLILLSVRNQDGTAPWTTIQHVVIERCRGRFGGSGLKILGQDDSQPSVCMTDVVIDNLYLSDLDPQGITGGDGRGIYFLGGADSITIQNTTMEGKNLGTSMYATEPWPTSLVLRNVKLPDSEYGMKLDAGGSGIEAWKAAMPDAIIEDVSLTATGASDYPALPPTKGRA